MNTAEIVANKFTVTRHSVDQESRREYIEIAVPNLWDDVKQIHHRVLMFDGREFTFSGWNSDTARSYFVRPLVGKQMIAELV